MTRDERILSVLAAASGPLTAPQIAKQIKLYSYGSIAARVSQLFHYGAIDRIQLREPRNGTQGELYAYRLKAEA